MSASHTKTASGANLRVVPGLGLVDFDGAGLPEALAEKVDGEFEIFATHMRHGLLSAATNVGLDVFSQLLGAEVTEVAGVKGHRRPARRAVRHSTTERSTVPLGARMVEVDKPRVRSTDGSGEVSLATWARFE